MKIGIDIGGNHVAVGLLNMTGKMVCKSEREISNDLDNKEFEKILIDIIIEQIQYVLEKKDLDITNVSQIGIAVPGMVNGTKIVKAENLHIKNFDIGAEINEYYNVPIKLRNDAKCAALAEKEYGSLKKYDDSLFIGIGTGIGGAVFLGGELLVPKKYEGFELGHVVIHKNGILCNCGRRGCFEKYASMSALKKKIANAIGKENISGQELAEILEQNTDNEKINMIVDQYIEDLSLGITNLINIFEPEAISLGGSFTFFEDTLFKKLKNKLSEEKLFNENNVPKMELAKLKNDAGIIGAVI